MVTLHDGLPVPKVIDFGIAKATEGRLTDSTVYTQLHQFIGTPAYMSPEQTEMSGLDIDHLRAALDQQNLDYTFVESPGDHLSHLRVRTIEALKYLSSTETYVAPRMETER